MKTIEAYSNLACLAVCAVTICGGACGNSRSSSAIKASDVRVEASSADPSAPDAEGSEDAGVTIDGPDEEPGEDAASDVGEVATEVGLDAAVDLVSDAALADDAAEVGAEAASDAASDVAADKDADLTADAGPSPCQRACEAELAEPCPGNRSLESCLLTCEQGHADPNCGGAAQALTSCLVMAADAAALAAGPSPWMCAQGVGPSRPGPGVCSVEVALFALCM